MYPSRHPTGSFALPADCALVLVLCMVLRWLQVAGVLVLVLAGCFALAGAGHLAA